MRKLFFIGQNADVKREIFISCSTLAHRMGRYEMNFMDFDMIRALVARCAGEE